MPIQPIDIQTLFARLQQIGKEQADLKDSAAQHQALQGSEIARRTEQQNHSVNQSPEIGEGLEQVNENGRREGKQERRKEKRKEKPDQEEVLKDPNLGKHIDLTG